MNLGVTPSLLARRVGGFCSPGSLIGCSAANAWPTLATPWLPTTTRPAVSAPSLPFSATTKTAAPGARSAGVAAAKVTIGVPSGIDIFFSWPSS
jgi:hypothetical protein